MDDREFGFYMRCLNHAWLNHGLPGELARLAVVMGRTKGYVNKIWPAIAPCFEIESGRFFNRKQEESRENVREFLRKRQASANSRWSKSKKIKTLTDASAMQVQCSPTASASPTATPKEEERTFRLDEFFEGRYRRHPKKGHRTAAEMRMAEVPEMQDNGFRERFALVHDGWCDTESWKWKNGAKAPYFDEWIVDKGYLYEAPEDEDSESEAPRPRLML
jgi:uncharacterized protein YdaU (DUF1376 family)